MAYTTIDDPSAYFQAKTYTGTGSSLAITNDGNSNLQPDWLWIKNRGTVDENVVHDSVRGVGKRLLTDGTQAEATTTNQVTSFDTNGFTVPGGSNNTGASSNNYIAWQWLAGTTSGITTDGNTTITPSSYSFNQTSGFSILSFTGNGVDGAKLAHGLGTTPAMVIIKRYSTTGDWVVYHKGVTTGKNVFLNYDIAETDGGLTNGYIYSPDGTNITLSNHADVNNSGVTTIAYCFAEKKGYSKFTSFTGNGSSDGTFVYLGFRAAFLIIKRTDTSANWQAYDNKRDGYNGAGYPAKGNESLRPNSNVAESSATGYDIDILSNGIKLRNSSSTMNSSGASHIVMAFAESPFVTSTGIPCLGR